MIKALLKHRETPRNFRSPSVQFPFSSDRKDGRHQLHSDSPKHTLQLTWWSYNIWENLRCFYRRVREKDLPQLDDLCDLSVGRRSWVLAWYVYVDGWYCLFGFCKVDCDLRVGRLCWLPSRPLQCVVLSLQQQTG